MKNIKLIKLHIVTDINMTGTCVKTETHEGLKPKNSFL